MKKIFTIIYHLTFTIIIGGLLFSCTETNQVINSNQKPVVEAYLAPGAKVNLRLTTAIPYSETETVDSISHPIDGQKIQIKVSDGKVFNLTNIGNGYYESANNELVKFGLTYELSFNYNNSAIKSITSIPTRPVGLTASATSVSLTQIDFSQGRPMGGGPGGLQEDNTPIVLTWNNPTGEYYFVTQLTAEANPEPVFIAPTNGNNGRGGPRRVNNQPTNGAIANLQPRSFNYFGKYYVILYKVSPDYAALYRSGGTSTQNISTPPTNVTNGLGIFTGVHADTLKVTVLKK